MGECSLQCAVAGQSRCSFLLYQSTLASSRARPSAALPPVNTQQGILNAKPGIVEVHPKI